LPGFGCEVQVIELVRRYEDGRMDVATKGLQVFQLISFDNPAPQKLYSGGQVVLMPEAEAYPWVSVDLLEKTELLYRYLDTPTLYDPELPQPYSFQVAHKIGLTLEQEYNLLQMSTEAERQSFLEIHLEKVLPVMEQMQRTRERIRLNGHFKNLDPLEF
jgi:Lon protease-like protein